MSDVERRTGGFCPKCGARTEAGDAFCVNCGAKLGAGAARPVTPAEKDRAETPPARPKQGWKRLLWLAVVGLVAYGGGQLLGGQLAGSFKSKPAATTVPLALNTPIARAAKAGQTDDAGMSTAIPTEAPLPTYDLSSLIPAVTMPTLEEIISGSQESWDYIAGDDSQIRDAMTLFWFGTDSRTGANCAFFANTSGNRGGYYWWIKNSEGFKAAFDLGVLIDERSGTLLSRSGKTPLLLDLHQDGALDFNFGDDDYIDGSMRLYPNGDRREEVMNMILNYKHTLEKMG